MLVLLSPAKRLDETSPIPGLVPSEPRFGIEARRIARVARTRSADDLRALMGISAALAELNVDRFKRFGRGQSPRPAAFTFAGDVYRGFDAPSLDAQALAFAQARVRMLSGLYGMLRPLDLIEPYRLEMGIKLAVGTAPSLVDYWGPKLARAVREELTAQRHPAVLNLASVEYFAPLAGKRLGAPVTHVTFLDAKSGLVKFNSFAAKYARGRMARWICANGIDTPEAVRGFGWDGYTLDANGSTASDLRFVRTR